MSSAPLPSSRDRIAVVGTTGSGKTTTAQRLAALLGIPHVELDALFWGPAWTEAPRDRFLAQVIAATNGDAWVVDGNYGGAGAAEIVRRRATFLVWLDLPLLVIVWRVLLRTLRRVVHREALWHGNRERFANAFLSRDSLLLYALRTHRRRRTRIEELLRSHPHLTGARFRSSAEVERWLTLISASSRVNVQQRHASGRVDPPTVDGAA